MLQTLSQTQGDVNGLARTINIPWGILLAAGSVTLLGGVVLFRMPIAEAGVKGFLRARGFQSEIDFTSLDFSQISASHISLKQRGRAVVELDKLDLAVNWKNPISPQLVAVGGDRLAVHLALGAGGLQLRGLDEFIPKPRKGPQPPLPRLDLRNSRIDIATPAGPIGLDLQVSGGGDSPLMISGSGRHHVFSLGKARADIEQYRLLAIMDGNKASAEWSLHVASFFDPGLRLEKARLQGALEWDGRKAAGRMIVELGRFENTASRVLGFKGQMDLTGWEPMRDKADAPQWHLPPDRAQGTLAVTADNMFAKQAQTVQSAALEVDGSARESDLVQLEGLSATGRFARVMSGKSNAPRPEIDPDADPTLDWQLSGDWRIADLALPRPLQPARSGGLGDGGSDTTSRHLGAIAGRIQARLAAPDWANWRGDVNLLARNQALSAAQASSFRAWFAQLAPAGLPEPIQGEVNVLFRALAQGWIEGSELSVPLRLASQKAEKSAPDPQSKKVGARAPNKKFDGLIHFHDPLVWQAANGLTMEIMAKDASDVHESSGPANSGQSAPFLRVNLDQNTVSGSALWRIKGPKTPDLQIGLTDLALDAVRATSRLDVTYASATGQPDQLGFLVGDAKLAMDFAPDSPPKMQLELPRASAVFTGTAYNIKISQAHADLAGRVWLDDINWFYRPTRDCLKVKWQRAALDQTIIGPVQSQLCASDKGLLRADGPLTQGGFRVSNLIAPLILGENSKAPPLFSGPATFKSLELRFQADDKGVRTVILAPSIEARGPSLLGPALYATTGALAIQASALPSGAWKVTGTSEAIGLAESSLAFRLSQGKIAFSMIPLPGAELTKTRILLDQISARLADSSAQPSFQPIILSGAARLEGDAFSARISPALAATNTALGQLVVQSDLVTNIGHADYATDDIVFSPDGLQPKAIIPALGGQINAASGTVSANVSAAWAPERPMTTSAIARLKDLAFTNVVTGPITGLSTQVEFLDLLTLQTRKSQILGISEINPGIPVRDLQIAYSIGPSSLNPRPIPVATRPSSPAVAASASPILAIFLENARIPIAGGALVLGPTEIPLLPGPQTTLGSAATKATDVKTLYRFQVEGVKLQPLLELMQITDWKVTGDLVGEIPLEIEGIRASIVNGRLRADGGRLQGNEQVLDTLAQVDPVTGKGLQTAPFGPVGPKIPSGQALAFQGLKDFVYKSLELTINGDLTGDIKIGIDLDGRGDAILGGLPLRYRINSNFNVGDIQRAFSSLSSVSQGLKAENILQLAREQEAAAQKKATAESPKR